MTYMRLTPSRTPASLEEEVNRLFSRPFRPAILAARPTAAWLPPVNVHESPEAYTVEMDLPGVNPKDVKVRLIEDRLTIQGERPAPAEQPEGSRTHRIERPSGKFERVFTLPAPVEAGAVKAAYKDGVLEVRVPKAPAARPQDIEIEVR